MHARVGLCVDVCIDQWYCGCAVNDNFDDGGSSVCLVNNESNPVGSN